MMEFRAFFCDPVEADIIDLGEMAQETIMDTFEKVDWNEYLQKAVMPNSTKYISTQHLALRTRKVETGLLFRSLVSPIIINLKLRIKAPKSKIIFRAQRPDFRQLLNSHSSNHQKRCD